MECSSVAIAAGLEESTEWVEEHCEALVRRHQFLSPARLVELPDGTITPRYKFSHILYLEVPYRLLPAMRRAQIHRRIGHRGEAIYGERVGEIAAELAMHFEQGKDPPRAVRYLLMAAENATHRSAHHEADALARRGLSALATLTPSPDRDQQELGLRMVLGVSVMSLKGFADDEVRDIYGRAIELCGGADQLTAGVPGRVAPGTLLLLPRRDAALPRDRRTARRSCRAGWPIRCLQAKRRCALGVTRWTWASSGRRWSSSTGCSC